MSRSARTRWRAGNGLVFQRSGLVYGQTALENICDPHILAGHTIDHDWVGYLLDKLDLSDVAKRSAGLLSGGQQQRVAMVRAVAHHPRIVFCDEPTANLHTQLKETVHRFLADISVEVPVVMVSHDPMTRDFADDVITMRDGSILGPSQRKAQDSDNSSARAPR